MTHSLHRKGSVEDLQKDFVILAMLARNVNDKKLNARKNLLRIGEIFQQHQPTNIMPKKVWNVTSIITASFDNIEILKKVLKILKEEDLGISIVVSGLIDEMQEAARELDLRLHTAHISLGVFGNKEKLPSDDILEMTTMCGHHCISPQFVEYHVDLIKNNKISIEKAAEKLAKPCICGIFNKSRAINMLNELKNR